MFSYEAWNAPESLQLDRADNNILKLSQKVPFPGKRTLAGTIAEGDAEMAHRDAQSAELDVRSPAYLPTIPVAPTTTTRAEPARQDVHDRARSSSQST